MSKIEFPQLPFLGSPVSSIKRWSLLSHPYFTGSGNYINPFPNEQLQLKSHIARMCPQDIEKCRRVKGRRQALCEITKWKTMRCIFVFWISRKRKKVKEQAIDLHLKLTLLLWETCKEENQLNDLSWSGAKVNSACSLKHSGSIIQRILTLCLPFPFCSENPTMASVVQIIFYGTYKIVGCRCHFLGACLAWIKSCT